MVGTIGKQKKMAAILFFTIGKQNFKIFGIPTSGIKAPTGSNFVFRHLWIVPHRFHFWFCQFRCHNLQQRLQGVRDPAETSRGETTWTSGQRHPGHRRQNVDTSKCQRRSATTRQNSSWNGGSAFGHNERPRCSRGEASLGTSQCKSDEKPKCHAHNCCVSTERAASSANLSRYSGTFYFQIISSEVVTSVFPHI